jgi:hypothetical protein
MHTVVLTHAFVRAAEQSGISEGEIDDLVAYIAANPDAGEAMAGTGGFRKLRFAGRGKGKSGGYRTITFYSGVDIPVYLITVFSKGEKSNLSKRERNQLKAYGKELVEEYRGRVVKVGSRR